MYEVSLAKKPWCLRKGAKHTDFTLLILTTTCTTTTQTMQFESDPYVTTKNYQKYNL